MSKSIPGIVLVGVALVLLGVAQATSSFFARSDSTRSFGVGLIFTQRCRMSECESRVNMDVAHSDRTKLFALSGLATSFVTSIASILLLITLIRAAIHGRNGRVLGWVAFGFTISAMMNGFVFLSQQPFGAVSPPYGTGFYAFMLGIVAALAGTVLVALNGAKVKRAEQSAGAGMQGVPAYNPQQQPAAYPAPRM